MQATVKITNGQIRIPIEIRKKMNIKNGDEFAITTNEKGIEIIHPNVLALIEAQKAFKGVADELGLKNEDDVVKMIKEIRAEK
jgi:AbrB family looped-hinge helix DNA binding protein